MFMGQIELNEEVAKDGTLWTTVPSDAVSLGRRQQHNVLRDVPGPSSFAIRTMNVGPPSNILLRGGPLPADDSIWSHIYKPYPDRTEAGNQSISLATRNSDVVFSSRT
ncbi:hypothetical protein AVEN_131530-1 [Araneus ventricosus]|uniref:Uncharacterized protein n=1 Tax=Araneus ventricosus TaxID=182803 RepID=A0A4Y2NWX1_ARAVE|nr:hypothetical protein AVEN_131530-1 [Araneus ventricosus]